MDITGVALPNPGSLAHGHGLPQRSNVMVTAGMARCPGSRGSCAAFRVYMPGRRPDQAVRVGVRRRTARGSGTRRCRPPPPQHLHRAADGTMIALTAANAGARALPARPRRRRPHRGPRACRLARSSTRRRPCSIRRRSIHRPMPTTRRSRRPRDRRAGVRRRERRHAARLRRAHGRRGLGLRPVQPAAEAEGPAGTGRPSGRSPTSWTARRRSRTSRSAGLAHVPALRPGAWRHVLPGARRHADRHGVDPVRTTATRGALLSFFSQPKSHPARLELPGCDELRRRLAPYGDIKRGASAVEKTVGETWSDPAVGQVETRPAT